MRSNFISEGFQQKIQVYGIPRSGTNFVEFSLRENFEDSNYSNFYLECDIECYPKIMFESNTRFTALKHSFPTLEHSNFAIVIYKEYEKSNQSYKRWSGFDLPYDFYLEYLEKARSLDRDRTIIFEHSWLCENYRCGMKMISEKFNLKMKEEIVQPANVLNKAGARCKQQKNKFILK